VRVECLDAVHEGRLTEIAFAGLELDLTGGDTRRLLPETVRHVQELQMGDGPG
jgi:hypothetical protein